jgi:hypothetical protein
MSTHPEKWRQPLETKIGSENWRETAEQLKPLEELEGKRADSGPLVGAIRVDDQVPVPNGVIERETKKRFGIDQVVLIIAGLMLVFIAFIAWQVFLMSGPAKP